MKTQNGFTLMNKNEIASYLAKQKVTRKITRLQVHHMDLPNYSTNVNQVTTLIRNIWNLLDTHRR